MKIKTKRGARRIRNQRVIDRRFVVTDYDGCSYITAGKLYRVIDWVIKRRLASIESNSGRLIGVRFDAGSAHLNDRGTWYHPIR